MKKTPPKKEKNINLNNLTHHFFASPQGLNKHFAEVVHAYY